MFLRVSWALAFMRTCVNEWLCSWLHTFVYTCIFSCADTYILTNLHIYIHACTQTYLHTYLHICAGIFTCVQTWLHYYALAYKHLLTSILTVYIPNCLGDHTRYDGIILHQWWLISSKWSNTRIFINSWW